MTRRKLLAEAIGTFAMVFAGTGAIIINDLTGGGVTHVGIALTFGLVVMAMIYAVGDVSGAHLNPAVTFGFLAARRTDARLAIQYIAAQLVGALVASGTLRLLFPLHPTLGATIPIGSDLQSFALEAILTLILMFVILSVAIGSKERGVMAGVAIGGVIGLEAMFAGPISGASMNPFRSLAPAIVSGHLAHVWLYLIAPVLGALVAVPLWRGVYDHGGKVMSRKRVVFICVENSNRSQMAEAFARMHGADRVDACSAGSRPSGAINPKAIAAMREKSYDLTAHRSKSLNDLPQIEWDYAITMGCGDDCPNLRAKHREDWSLPDPKHLPPDQFNQVRDDIESRVQALLERIER